MIVMNSGYMIYDILVIYDIYDGSMIYYIWWIYNGYMMLYNDSGFMIHDFYIYVYDGYYGSIIQWLVMVNMVD